MQVDCEVILLHAPSCLNLVCLPQSLCASFKMTVHVSLFSWTIVNQHVFNFTDTFGWGWFEEDRCQHLPATKRDRDCVVTSNKHCHKATLHQTQKPTVQLTGACC